MKLSDNWEKLHHANLVLGTGEDIWQALLLLDFKRAGNPDALHMELETLGIDEARELSNWSYKKPFGSRKVVVVSLKSFTSEAQNALLKLFEEPPLGTYFFLALSSVGSILPTLLSRVRIIESGPSLGVEDGKAEKFLKSDLSQRFKIINPIIKNKDREKAKELVSGLLSHVDRGNPANLENLFIAEKHLSIRSSSIKMILESLAIMIV